MRTKTSALVVLAAMLFGTACSPAGAEHDGNHATRVSLQKEADTLVSKGAPGVLTELRTPDGGVKVRSGVGDTDARTPVPWDAHFRIASFSKTFVATTLLQLVGEHRLALDDTVETWLPGVVTGNGNDGSKITIRQLLQHTSGIPEYIAGVPVFTESDFQQHRFDEHSPADLVALAMRQAPTFAPGAGWSYSNTNYVLAGMIIGKVTGRDWRAAVDERIIKPLGLRNTSIPGHATALPHPHATAYERFPEDVTADPLRFGKPIDVTELNPSYAEAAGELISTTNDALVFLRALISGELLAPAELAEMQKTVPAPSLQSVWPEARYGLGIAWIPTACGGYWSHAGDIQGFQTRNGITPDGKRSVIVSMNTDSVIPEEPSTPPTPLEDPSFTLVKNALCDRR
jgi:D-alanyl-D-alanine carboxypeptidase